MASSRNLSCLLESSSSRGGDLLATVLLQCFICILQADSRPAEPSHSGSACHSILVIRLELVAAAATCVLVLLRLMSYMSPVQTYSATETQLMRRNGDVEHVRRSRRAGALGAFVSPEQNPTAGEDSDTDSQSSEGPATAHNAMSSDGQPKEAEVSAQKSSSRKGGRSARSSSAAAEAAAEEPPKASVSVKQKKKRKKSEAGVGTGFSDAPGTGKKGARTMRHKEPAE